MHRPTPRTEALPAARALGFLILTLASGCAGDRPTFGQRVGTGDGGFPDATAPSGDITEPPDAANSTAAEIDASGMSDVNDAGVVESAGGDGAIDRANIDASQAVESRDGDASVQKTEGDMPALEADSGVSHVCDETIDGGVAVKGTSGTLGSTTIADINLLYLSELELYTLVFMSAGPSPRLRLATVDETGNVVSEPTSIASPLLDKSSLEMSPEVAWNGSTLGVLLRGRIEEETQLLGLTLALDGTVLSERQWPLNTVPDHGFELAVINDEFLGFWHLTNAGETLSVVQRLDAELQPVGSTWQPLAAEPWLPAVTTQGPQIALTRGTREEAQLHVLSDSLEPMHIASVDEPNSATPLVVGTSSGYVLAWNRSNQQVRFAKYGKNGTLSCGPVTLSAEPRRITAVTAVQGGYLALTTTDDNPQHVQWFAVSEDCVVGSTSSVSYESTGVPAAASGASTMAVAWVEDRTYMLKYTVVSNNLCQ